MRCTLRAGPGGNKKSGGEPLPAKFNLFKALIEEDFGNLKYYHIIPCT